VIHHVIKFDELANRIEFSSIRYKSNYILINSIRANFRTLKFDLIRFDRSPRAGGASGARDAIDLGTGLGARDLAIGYPDRDSNCRGH
jgi:hypothetical protein